MSKNGTAIHDYRGGALRLEATRLIEDYSAPWLNNNWMASYASIRKAYRENRDRIRIEETAGPTGKKIGVAIWSGFYRPGDYINPFGVICRRKFGVIGCRRFTTRTFNIILKAAGVVKATTKKKALAAKARR
jgi:hypothetical protein